MIEPDRPVRNPNMSQIGDYVAVEDLIRAGGRFYRVDLCGFCDLPAMTFRLARPEQPGYERVE